MELLVTGVTNFVRQTLDNSFTVLKVVGAGAAYSISPEYQHQREQDKRNREDHDRNQANVSKSIENNVTVNMPNGDPTPKRNDKIATVVSAIGAGAEVVRSLLEPASTNTTKSINNAEKSTHKENNSNINSPMIQPIEKEKKIIIPLMPWTK